MKVALAVRPQDRRDVWVIEGQCRQFNTMKCWGANRRSIEMQEAIQGQPESRDASAESLPRATHQQPGRNTTKPRTHKTPQIRRNKMLP